jgi:hypothetical protein
MSYLSSAGIARGAPGYGMTCRQDVLRSVDVPVVPGAARRARPVLGGQAQLGEQVPARRARLREPCRTRRCLLLPRFAGRRIPSRPEGRGILRRSW